VTEIQFVRPPDTGLLSAVWPRKSGLDEGETIPRISMRIGGVVAAELEAYREVCGFPSGPDLPLTFPQVAAAPLHMALFTHKVFPLPAMGLVHVSSEITQHHPIPGKAPMDVHVWVEGHRPARRGIEADLMTEVSVDGQVAWKSTTTVLSMAGKGDGVKRTGPEIPAPQQSRSLTWQLPTDLGRRYAKVAGDRNPIHMYPWTAKLFGFKRHIIHGMWLLARAVAELDMQEEEALRLQCSFKRPVFLPGSPVFMGGPHGGGTAFQVCRARDGKPHLHGWMGPASVQLM
jgi:hypothetical protein